MKIIQKIMIAFIAVSILTNGIAAEFCVTNSQELQDALTSAGTNNQHDVIRVATGNYEGGFSYGGFESFDLTIIGGFTPFIGNPCGQRTGNPLTTFLDGNNAQRILLIQAAASSNISISYLSFINGFSVNGSNSGAGLEIRSLQNYVGDVLVEYTGFINNESDFASALEISGATKQTVRNSFFVSNNSVLGTGTVNLISNDSVGIYFNNNTMINNTKDQLGLFNHAGLRIFTTGSSKVFVANNIMKNNEIADIRIFNGGDTAYLYNNNVGNIFGNFDEQADNINSNPMFESGFFNFVPTLSSGEVNQGRNSANLVPVPTPFTLDWFVGSTDFNGNPRVRDGRVDIGAFEAVPETPIFSNGFEILL